MRTLEPLFFTLILIIGVFFFVSVLFAIYTILLKIWNNRKAKFWNRLEGQWEPQVLAILAENQDPKELCDQIREDEQLYFVDYILRFARRLKGEDVKTLSRIARPFLSKVAGRLNEGDDEQRARGVYTLGALAFYEHAKEIIHALDDPSPLVAMVAAKALTREEHPEYAQAVVSKMHRFENWSRQFLASMLRDPGDALKLSLREMLINPSESLHVRIVSAEALLKLNDLPSADLAVEILNKEKNSELQVAALKLLKYLGRAEHVSIIRLLCHSSDEIVTAHALGALGKLGDSTDVPILRSSLDDSSPWVALHAARALMDLGQVALLKELAASQHPRANLGHEMISELKS